MEIGGFLMGLSALLTAIYAIWGGRQRRQQQNVLTFSDIESKLRTALYSDFQKQREENERLQRQIKAMKAELETLEAQNAEQQEEIDKLRIEVDEHKDTIASQRREIDRLKSGRRS